MGCLTILHMSFMIWDVHVEVVYIVLTYHQYYMSTDNI